MDDKRVVILNVHELRIKFHKELDDIYGTAEVDSFFFLASEHILGKGRVDLVLEPNLSVDETDLSRYKEVLLGLKLEKPIQYIFEETQFFGLTFKVNEHVLIPRPETEELVNMVLKSQEESTSLPNILDIGTGSGAIAISLAKNLPLARIWALDVSEEALDTAAINAECNDVKISIKHGDILNHDDWENNFPNDYFDIIVSNPPYVRHLEKQHMKTNVLDYEPHLALFVDDNDPLQFYRHIKQFALKKLRPKGKLFLEINQYLGEQTQKLFVGDGFEKSELHTDLSGNDRFVKASKSSN